MLLVDVNMAQFVTLIYEYSCLINFFWGKGTVALVSDIEQSNSINITFDANQLAKQ